MLNTRCTCFPFSCSHQSLLSAGLSMRMYRPDTIPETAYGFSFRKTQEHFRFRNLFPL